MDKFIDKYLITQQDKKSVHRYRNKYGSVTSIIGILINLILFVGKFIAGTLISSVSVTADAINNLSDAGSSIIALVSFKISSKPADRDHPFGHARFEYVASMIVSFIIMTIGFRLISTSVEKIIHPEEGNFSVVTVIILAVSILLKLWLFLFYKKIGKRLDSTVIIASSADSLSDVVSTSAVLASVIIIKLTGFNTDGYMGVAVAVFIMFSGLKILLETKNHILGMAPDESMMDKIVSEAKSHPETLGVHDIVIHNYGPGRCFASLHVEVDGRSDIFQTHDVIDNIEKDVFNKLGVHCVIHLDPIETDNQAVNRLKEKITFIITGINRDITIHDFRYVPGHTHTNLIFDIAVPYEVKEDDAALVADIEAAVHDILPNYNAIITVDRG